MKTYKAQLHFRERSDSTDAERYFDSYITGDAQTVFGPNDSIKCALSSRAAIAHKVEMERRAWQWSNAQKVDISGNPVEAEVVLEVVFDNFSHEIEN